MKIVIGVAAAVVFFLLAFKMIKPSRRKEDETSHYICDACKGQVCECRPDNGREES